jgi:hypothetical protein
MITDECFFKHIDVPFFADPSFDDMIDDIMRHVNNRRFDDVRFSGVYEKYISNKENMFMPLRPLIKACGVRLEPSAIFAVIPGGHSSRYNQSIGTIENPESWSSLYIPIYPRMDTSSIYFYRDATVVDPVASAVDRWKVPMLINEHEFWNEKINDTDDWKVWITMAMHSSFDFVLRTLENGTLFNDDRIRIC